MALSGAIREAISAPHLGGEVDDGSTLRAIRCVKALGWLVSPQLEGAEKEPDGGRVIIPASIEVELGKLGIVQGHPCGLSRAPDEGGNQSSSEVIIRCNQRHPYGLSRAPAVEDRHVLSVRPSDAIRRNQAQSDALRRHQQRKYLL